MTPWAAISYGGSGPPSRATPARRRRCSEKPISSGGVTLGDSAGSVSNRGEPSDVRTAGPFADRAPAAPTMTTLDLALVNAVERCCQRFQRLTGRTNVWLALQLTNLSIIVYFVAAGLYFLRISLVPRIGLALFCAALLYALTQTVFRVPIEAYEQNAYRRVARRLRNPRRVRDVALRISFLVLSLLLPVQLLWLSSFAPVPLVFVLAYSLIVLTTVILYLLACDPLPPCMGTLPAKLFPRAASRAVDGGTATPAQRLKKSA